MREIWAVLNERLNKKELSRLSLIIEGENKGEISLFNLEGRLLAGQNMVLQEPTKDFFNSRSRIYAPKPNMQLYEEVIFPRPVLLILGGGHIAVPLSRMGNLLDYEVVVVDDRSEFAAPSRFPAARVLQLEFSEVFNNIEVTPSHLVVIVTRGHMHDLECLQGALQSRASYIGMIGSEKKVQEIFQELKAQGYSQEKLNKVHSPIGLKIGARTPAEIAVSITAEIIAQSGGLRGSGIESVVQDILQEKKKAAKVLATVIEAEGSAPAGSGARLLMDEGGYVSGTVGGGSGELSVLEKGQEVLKDGRPRMVSINMDRELAAGEGMICGGSMKIFVQEV